MPAPKEMIKAAKAGNAARVVELLAEDPSLLHARDTDGSTPLHCAAWKGHAEVVRVLLEHGKAADTPAAAVRWAATGQQETVTAPLHGLPAAVQAAGLSAPATAARGSSTSDASVK